jgi:hypothetical protein
VGKKESSYTAGGNVIAQPLWKTVWRLFKKLKVVLPYNPAVPLLGKYLKDCESAYKYTTFIAALFIIVKL